MKISFHGAARQVTGSMFLLETQQGSRILIDCGFDMENKKANYQVDMFPFDPKSLDAVVLTHAHIDHSGNLPHLFRLGYEGKIYCTGPSMYLSQVLLLDSAHLNSQKLNQQNNRKRRGKKENQALFLEREVNYTLGHMAVVPFHQQKKLTRDVSVEFNPTGHLPGAANLLFRVEENGKTTTIGFSGDVGRKNYPLLNDPHPFPQVDYLVCESTYGNRLHTPVDDSWSFLESVVRETCVDMHGRLIIPAFSVGRTQAMIYVLEKLFSQGRLPRIKVFVDSPMAIASTHAYDRFADFLSADARAYFKQHGSLFDYENLILVERASQSRAIANHYEPCIIISASGMLEGGRIQHHVKANLSNPYATILMVGFAAEGTLGHTLMQKPKSILFNGKLLSVNARIESMDSLSGHADQNELLDFLSPQKPEKTKKIFLVHGEPNSMDTFKSILNDKGFSVEIPEKDQSFQLN